MQRGFNPLPCPTLTSPSVLRAIPSQCTSGAISSRIETEVKERGTGVKRSLYARQAEPVAKSQSFPPFLHWFIMHCSRMSGVRPIHPMHSQSDSWPRFIDVARLPVLHLSVCRRHQTQVAWLSSMMRLVRMNGVGVGVQRRKTGRNTCRSSDLQAKKGKNQAWSSPNITIMTRLQFSYRWNDSLRQPFV